MPATQDQIQELLDALDRSAHLPEHDGRRSRRLAYRSCQLTVEILNDRGFVGASFTVPTRNLSKGGLAFLHKQMLIPGTKVHLKIPMVDDRILEIGARVSHCRHVNGMMHEIGVVFEPTKA